MQESGCAVPAVITAAAVDMKPSLRRKLGARFLEEADDRLGGIAQRDQQHSSDGHLRVYNHLPKICIMRGLAHRLATCSLGAPPSGVEIWSRSPSQAARKSSA